MGILTGNLCHIKPPPHRKTETKMFLFKLIAVAFVALASAQEEQSPSSYANYLTGGFQQPLYQGQQQIHPVADKRQGFNINNIDGVTAAALSGGANAVYTTVGLLSINSRTTNNCNKINEMLNVADLATQTVTVGDSSTNAGLTSTQTAITAIFAKINEILKKSTLKC